MSLNIRTTLTASATEVYFGSGLEGLLSQF